MFYQAKADLEKEARAAIEMAKSLVQTDISVAQLQRILHSNRDLSVVSSHTQQTPTTFAQSLWEAVFADPHPTHTLITKSGKSITVTANSLAELEEITATMVNVFFIFLFALLVTLFTLRFAVNTRLKPLAELRAGLDSLKDGQFEVSRASTDIAEIQTLIEHYNNLIATLETKETQVTELRKRLADLQEDERRRLARELHDNLGQLITGINVQTYMLTRQKDNPDYIAQACAVIQQQREAVQNGVKELTNQLYPVFLQKLGLIPSLEQLVQTWQSIHNVAAEWRSETEHIEQDLTRDTHIYRITQEVLNNIAKHAEATKVWVNLTENEKGVTLRIQDNGKGMNIPSPESSGLGLDSIRERAAILGAALSLTSDSSGTLVELCVPINTAAQSPEEV